MTSKRTLPLNGVAWRRLRALILDNEPLCRHCYEHGRVTPATDIDHINNDASDNSVGNLQGLCHSCHSVKTQADMGKRTRTSFDANGMPIDPHHGWNREKSPAAGASEPRGGRSFNAKGNEP